EQTRRLMEEITDPDGEDQIALRHGTRYVARLRASPSLDPGASAPRLRAEGAYLVTGGLGALGLQVAAWLVRGGGRDLVLVGRRGLPERSAWPDLPPASELGRKVAAVEALERAGARVRVRRADVGDLAQMRAVFEQIANEGLPWRGIIHAAAQITGQ